MRGENRPLLEVCSSDIALGMRNKRDHTLEHIVNIVKESLVINRAWRSRQNFGFR